MLTILLTPVRALLRPLAASAPVLCGLLLFVLAAPMCAAATYYVAPSGSDSNTGGQGDPYLTIQNAISNAASGDTVVVEAGTYTGPKNVDIDFQGRNLTLTAQSGAATVIDCAGSSSAVHRGFYLHSGEGKNGPAVIDGFTVKNGYSNGSNSRGGGGIYVASSDTVAIQNCTFTTCTSTGNGGGIDNEGTVSLPNCTFNGDTSNGNGAAVYNNGTLTVTNGTFMGNTAGNSGGGICNINSGNVLTLTNCTFNGNTAGYYGGGLANNGVMTVNGCNLTGNIVNSYGGGGISSGGTLTITGTVFANNIAKGGSGGAVLTNQAIVSMTACTIRNNASNNSNGGGLENDGYSSNTAILTNCLFFGNSASASGGGIHNSGPTLTLNYDTLSLNVCNGNGGGLYVDNGTAKLTDDILYNDTGGEAVDGTSGQTAIMATYCDILGGYAGTGVFDRKPLFVNPAGGDFHLKSGSPCIGTGITITGVSTDLDGKPRATPPSMGAYEGASGGHTHLLWNNVDGRVMLWSIAQDGTFTLNGFGPYTDGAAQNKWSATAVATGADGKSHILWNNTDGRVMLWTVDDAGNFTLAGYGPYTDNAPQNKWSATAVSVGPDGTVHLLWNNTDHRVMLWSVAPDFTFSLAGYGPYTDNAPGNLWSATALSTGPDGVSHIVWNNTDNRVMLWNVAPSFSFTLAGYGPYTDGAPQNLWSAAGLSVGPDNVQHILWTNTDRRAMFWNVNPDFSFTLAGYGPYTDNAPQNLWTATALATGPDGLSHLLWDNTDNRAMLWGVDSAFNFTVAGYGPYTDNAPGNLWSATAVSAGP